MRRVVFVVGWLLLGLVAVTTAYADPRLDSFARNERGRYLVIAGDCTACHTTEWGKPFAGGKPIPTPFGIIYSANITPDEQTGIGAWTDAEFLRAMRHGISADGSRLYPAFPYPWFTRVKRDDLLAIRAYLDTLAPVHNIEPDNELTWPMGWRNLMAIWNGFYLDVGEYVPEPEKSDLWNRGAYLVRGLGHCGACHTPKNWMGGNQEDELFAGYELQNWFAPNLGGDPLTGLGDWTGNDIVQFLRTGANEFAFAGALMREVVEKSTSKMRPHDLKAIAAYLKSLPDQFPEEEQYADEQSAAPAAERFPAGHRVYVDNCIGCHGYEGKGVPNVFPPLDGRATVVQDKATSLVHAILHGIQEASTEARPTLIAMPAFGWKLTDEQVAELVNYVRNAWGNHASAIEPSTVEEVRVATSAK